MFIFKDKDDNILTTKEVSCLGGCVVGKEMSLEKMENDEVNGMVITVCSEQLAKDVVTFAKTKNNWDLIMFKVEPMEWE